ncbi:MAG: c-type cytochrome domain-containing protein [Planctomycetota bacterium]|jgi:YHS domain-containing protein|nr:c-type cytochrome domain-containing protein [Planctomycetota bacterium]
MLSTLISLTLASPAPIDVDFLKDVYPILEAHCIDCHGPKKQKGDLRLDQRAGLFEGDEDFIPVVPGKPDQSTVIELITLDADDPDLMPKKADKLSDEDIAILRTWIEEGAAWEQPPVREVKVDPLALPPLSEEQIAVRDKALVALNGAGVRVQLIAENHTALEVNLSLSRDEGTDGQVALLAGLEPVLVWANFAGTKLTDAGLNKLADFGALRRLNLSGTAITDAGLASLAKLGELRSLNLYGTGVTDAGLKHLESLPSLERLYLWGTNVTPEAAKVFQASHPASKVNTGAELVVTEIATEISINTECPITSKAVSAAFVVLMEDQRVGLCCAECKAAFEADPSPHLVKLGLKEAGPVNEVCPVSDKPIVAGCTSEVGGTLVGFCCGKCKAAFDADPNPHLVKLGLKNAGPVNEVCPVSGKPIVAGCTSEVGGTLVGFCCGKCKAAFDEAPAKFLEKLGIEAEKPKLNAQCPVSGKAVDVAVTSEYKARTVAFCCGNCKKAFDADPGSFAEKLGDL